MSNFNLRSVNFAIDPDVATSIGRSECSASLVLVSSERNQVIHVVAIEIDGAEDPLVLIKLIFSLVVI